MVKYFIQTKVLNMVTTITGNLPGATQALQRAAEKYLHCGRRITTIYTRNIERGEIQGQDHKEPILLTALRILSWATLIFPAIALGIHCSISKGQWDQGPYAYTNWDRRARIRIEESLERSGIQSTAYDLSPHDVISGDPLQFAVSNMPYYGMETADRLFFFVEESTGRRRAPRHICEGDRDLITADMGMGIGDGTYCYLSDSDHRAMRFGQALSPAFVQMVQDR